MSNDRHTAFHEAGHCVMGHLLKLSSLTVTIVRDSEAGTLGSARVEDSGDPQEDVQVLLAGQVAAEIEIPGSGPSGAEDDDEKVDEILAVLSPDEQPKLKFSLTEKTREMLLANWALVKAIAEALLEHKTLDSEEVDTVLWAVENGEDWKQSLADYQEAKRRFFAEANP